MTPTQLRRIRKRLESYVDHCFSGMGRQERREALGHYLQGLLLDGERKSMSPVAARLAQEAGDREAIRQRLQQAVNVAHWDDGELYHRIAKRAEKGLADINAFVIDDTGFPKKGKHSVGVQRQYSGTLGRVDNCQVATSLHLASEQGGVCIGARLFLPESWSEDAARRRKTEIPDDVVHQPKWRIALELLDRALSWDLPSHVVLADAGYGDASDFRQGIRRRDLAVRA